MFSRHLLLTIGASAGCIGAAQAQQPAPQADADPPPYMPAPPAPAPSAERPLIAPPPPGARPLSSRLRLISGPDWSNPEIYPAAAHRLGQQGPVIFELLVGTDGRPYECKIAQSSGHAELDEGTCGIAMTMRFAPPRSAAGRPEEGRLRTRIVWSLAPDSIPFAPQRLAAEITLVGGRVVTCSLTGNGPLFGDWSRHACRTFELEADYYFGSARFEARRATVLVDFVPAGAALPPPPEGRAVTAVRTTAFTLSRESEPGDCRTLTDRGFGTPRIDHADACGFFVSQAYIFEPDDSDAPPRQGSVTVRVLLDPATAI